MFEGGRFDVLLVAAGDLARVAVRVEGLHVARDGGVGAADGGVVGGVGFGYVGWEGLGEGAEAEIVSCSVGGVGGVVLGFFGCCLILPLHGRGIYRWSVKMLGLVLAFSSQ